MRQSTRNTLTLARSVLHNSDVLSAQAKEDAYRDAIMACIDELQALTANLEELEAGAPEEHPVDRALRHQRQQRQALCGGCTCGQDYMCDPCARKAGRL